MSYYDVLGVPRYATFDQIKSAYRQQIKFFHPDVFEGIPEVADIKTRQLNEAYEVLSNPQRRFEYDRELYLKDKQFMDALQNKCSFYQAQAEANILHKQNNTEPKKTPESENIHAGATAARQPRKKKFNLGVAAGLFALLSIFAAFFYMIFTASGETNQVRGGNDSSLQASHDSPLESSSEEVMKETAQEDSSVHTGEQANTLYSEAVTPVQPYRLMQPLPENGEILYGGDLSYDSYSIMTVHAPTTADCVVKLKTLTGKTVFAFFVLAGESVDMYCPTGSFVPYFAFGTEWYGYDNLFGDTMYGQKDTLQHFDELSGWEYTLYPVQDGNLTLGSTSNDSLLTD